jgi:hypothetical protein
MKNNALQVIFKFFFIVINTVNFYEFYTAPSYPSPSLLHDNVQTAEHIRYKTKGAMKWQIPFLLSMVAEFIKA